MYLYSIPVPPEALCTPAACGTAQNAWRMVMLTCSSALRAALSGRHEADLPIRRSWLRGCHVPASGEVASSGEYAAVRFNP